MKISSKMNDLEFYGSAWHKSHLQSLKIGVLSPLHSLNFFLKNKIYLVIGVAPHVIALVAYCWFLMSLAVPHAQALLMYQVDKVFRAYEFLNQAPFLQNTISFIVGLATWLLGFLFYALLGTSLVNLISSPLHDIFAKKCYQTVTPLNDSKFSLADFIRSLVSEFFKFLILLLFLIFFVLLPIFIPGGIFLSVFVSPAILICTAWYNGWDFADRTLAILNLPFSKRVLFAFKAPGLCIGLGVWTLVPFVSNLMGFSLSGAGGIAIAKFNERKTK
jgi:hypothetical protein